MPIYEYQCEECDHNFEIEQGVKAKSKKKCPECGKNSLERLIFSPVVSIKGRINTVGQLAEANTKKLGRYAHDRLNKEKILSGQLQHEKEIKEKKDLNRKLNAMSNKAKEKYIKTGEM
jgi:putative FmdB family regulatory protein